MTRRRRRRLLVLLTLLALATGGLLLRLPTLTVRGLERALGSFFNRGVTVGQARWRLLPLEVEVLDLRVLGPTPGSPPFLEVPRLVAAPALAPIWLQRIVLARLRIERPVIRIHAFAEGGDDIPKMGGGGGGGFELRVRRLVIDDGAFELDHRRVPLQLDLPDFRGRMAARIAGALAGSLGFGPGRLRFGENPELPLATEMELRLEGPLLTVERARLHAERVDLVYEGQLRLASRPRGVFELKGAVDLEVLDRHLMRTGFGIKGAASWDGRVWVDGSRLRLKGRLLGRDGEFDRVPVKAFKGDVGWDEHGVHLAGLDVEAFGGAGRLDVEVPPGASVATLTAHVREGDAEGLTRWIFDLGRLGLGAAATGDVAISWPRGRFRELSGRIGIDLLARTDGRTPLWGRLEWRAERGVQQIQVADLKTPESSAQLAGRIQIDDHADLAVQAESRDVAASDELLTRLRRALGGADAQPAGLGGRGTFQGRWRGTLQDPVFDGRFEGEDVSFFGVLWGAARWTGSLTPGEIRMTALEVQRGDGLLRVEGSSQTGYYGDQDGLELRARLLGWPAEDFVRALGWRLELRGPLSGEVKLAGRRSAPLGEARLASRGGRYYGVPFQDLELQALLRAGATELRQGRARVGGGELRFRGALSDDGLYDGAVEANDIELQDLLKAGELELPLGGRVSGQLTVQGPLERPWLRGELRSGRLFFGDEGLGAVHAELSARGDGRVALDARCRSPRVEMALTGAVALEANAPSELKVSVADTSIDPFVRVLYPALPSVVTIVASGETRLSGPLARPRELVGSASVQALQVTLPDYPVRNREPLLFRFERGSLQLEDLRLAGEGTDLRLAGSAGLAGETPLDLSVEGAADLRVLSVVTRRLRGRGAARLAMSVRGTAEAPRIDGTLELSGGGLRVRGFPTGLEGLHGSVRFTEKAAQLEGVGGSFGGGDVELAGEANYALGKLSSVDLSAVGRRVALRYPEGLRSVLDLDLRLFGDATRQWLSGSIDVRHAQWTRRYDIASELLAASVARPGTASLHEGLRYDIKVRAPGTLEVDNNLATLRARADLNIAGSSEMPVILGRAEIDRGRVYFQGNTYTIRRGTIDFGNPRRIDPVFNIEAETRIRSYRVTLNMNGTLERVYPTLNSDPPLSAVQIVNLLAGADEAAVTSLTQSRSDQAKLAAAGAATLAAGRLSEEVGLERQAERLFGLNRFSIDPTLVRGDVTNPTARLTVGKRITPDLSVLYSIDLKGGQEQLLSVEYTLSDRFSVLLTSSEPGGVGIDVRVRQSR